MSRNYFYLCTPPGRSDAQAALRRGLTLVEILIAVTLMTFIMLAAIRVLTYVSAEMNRAQSSMVIAGRARAAQQQIEQDLACITAPLTPPLRFDDAQGYFCIIEGLGAHYGNLFHDGKIGWGLEDIAVNSETGEYDSTIGDCDDMIMFTARAPGDQMFRGLVGGKIMESKEAEICYFLRGTTLYRRVLLIIPDEILQGVLRNDPKYSSGTFTVQDGYGFYRDFDVSARLEWDDTAGLSGEWRIKANTLADLTRRENRFPHFSLDLNRSVLNQFPFPYSIHNNAAWYNLRLPTLAECTMDANNASWRLGKRIAVPAFQQLLVYDDDIVDNGGLWAGEDATNFPMAAGTPHIDYWNNPLPWNGNAALSPETRSLMPGTGFYDDASSPDLLRQRVNEDVLLTNVIGFDIKVWCPIRKEFIDLGQYRQNFVPANPDDARKFSKDLGSQGFFGTSNGTTCYSNVSGGAQYGLMPCVYDTHTDAYENDAIGNIFGATGGQIEGIAVDPNYDGIVDIMEHVDQWRCPPPYNVPLTGIQIKIRVFDPDTNNIREVTIRKNFN